MAFFTNLVKGTFLLFNFVFWVTGLALLVAGILVKFWFRYMIKLSTNIDYNLAPYITIGVGVFIVLVGFVGCWGALKDHGWALKMYMFILAVLFVAEIIGAATGFFMRNKMKSGLETGIRTAVHKYDKDADLRNAMDQVQEKIGCCGATTYKDYFNVTTANATVKESVPKSCCKTDVKHCAFQDLRGKPVNQTGIYTEGCYDTLLHDAEKNILIIGCIALGIVVFQLLGVGSAYVVTKKMEPEPIYERV